MKFSQILKKVMDSKGLSQMEVAKLSGISQTIVSRWLRSDLEPRISQLKPLAKALGMRVVDFTGDLSADNFTETEKRFLALPAQRKEFLLKLMDFLDTNER